MAHFAEELDRFGFCIMRSLIPLQDLDGLRAAIELGLTNQSLELVEAGLLPAEDEAAARSFATGISLLFQRNLIPPGAPVTGTHLRLEIAAAVNRLRRHPAITGLAKALLGSQIVATPQFALRAHCPGRHEFCFPWHQDIFFLDLRDRISARVVNFWIPLVPIDSTAGGLDVIKGSHRHGVLPHARAQQHPDAPCFTAVEPHCLPAGEIVAPELGIRDALVMLDKTVHRTRLNRSARVRWSVDIRYAEAGRPLGRSGEPLAIV